MVSRVKRITNAHDAAVRAVENLNGVNTDVGSRELAKAVETALEQAHALEKTLRQAIVEDAILATDRARSQA